MYPQRDSEHPNNQNMNMQKDAGNVHYMTSVFIMFPFIFIFQNSGKWTVLYVDAAEDIRPAA